MPQATRVFERLKIDYCCGGDQPLGDACASVGVGLERLERMLKDAAQNEAQESAVVDFQSLSLAELITHILDKHHVYTKEEMTRLDALIAKVVNAHGVNHSELRNISELFQRLCDDLTPHMFKEEQILFPYIIELEKAALSNRPAPHSCFGTVKNPVCMMMMEHDAVGDILRELRALSSDYTVPADGCISYQTLYQALEAFEQDLHQHIHLENNILFPRAIEMEGSP
jgi:regulator of cell morphogenesis and NO signaling